jgi:hypothetical protein
LAACPNKEAATIAHELSYLFGLIGFPHIFHSDNGTEFSKVVIAMLKEQSPAITTVTGRPRRPSDQGSVENQNKHIKDVLNSCEREDQMKGVVKPNWTHYLGRTMAALNMNQQRCPKGTTSAYESVFGETYAFSEKQCDHE